MATTIAGAELMPVLVAGSGSRIAPHYACGPVAVTSTKHIGGADSRRDFPICATVNVLVPIRRRGSILPLYDGSTRGSGQGKCGPTVG